MFKLHLTFLHTALFFPIGLFFFCSGLVSLLFEFVLFGVCWIKLTLSYIPTRLKFILRICFSALRRCLSCVLFHAHRAIALVNIFLSSLVVICSVLVYFYLNSCYTKKKKGITCNETESSKRVTDHSRVILINALH